MMRTRRHRHDARTVITCYNVFDKFFPTCGLLDYTEGIYHNDPGTPYEVAQCNQIDYLLDEVQCGGGVRVLDVGCGNGTLLDAVRRRGATGTGITISPEQVDLCKKRGLDVRLLNYKDLGEEWNGRFDAVIANGPMEHFVQPHEAVENKADEIYAHFFRTAHRLIDPQSPVRRLINTTIHFLRRPDPADLLKSPFSFPRGTDGFHYALLARSFGGFYPEIGQLRRCADGCFRLACEVDGTYDYHLTSEEWLRRIRKVLRTTMGARILAKALPSLLRHPKQFATMLMCMLVSESWNWQFRGPNPPTKLLRQTWDYQD
jgi:cyclopropane-fatty-acyl-phospholipid synthase